MLHPTHGLIISPEHPLSYNRPRQFPECLVILDISDLLTACQKG